MRFIIKEKQYEAEIYLMDPDIQRICEDRKTLAKLECAFRGTLLSTISDFQLPENLWAKVQTINQAAIEAKLNLAKANLIE